MTAEVTDATVFARPSSRDPERAAPRYAWATVAGWAMVAAAAAATMAAAALGRVSPLGALLVLAVLFGSGPFLRRIARGVDGVELVGILRLGLGLKFLAVLPRYELRQDARDYYLAGRSLVDDFLRFDFAVDPGRSIPGTGSVRYLSGLVQLFTFQDEFATFVVFATFGFVGTALFARAFIVALPAVHPGRYALLLMCWPSVVYWPSSTGKDAVMMLGLGLAAVSLARFLTGRYASFGGFLVGISIAGLVRPHVALIAVTAAVAALIFHSPTGRQAGVVGRSIVIAVLVLAGTVASNGVEEVFKIQDLNVSGLGAALDLANYRSAQGGSSFIAARIDSVLDAPWAVTTVLFRPFPHEAGSIPMLVTAAEGLVLLGLLVMAGPRLLSGLRALRKEAYTGYAIVFVGIFVYLFSALGNFGILARQRTMMTPLLLVLVALPTARERVRARRAARSTMPEPVS